jgi:beta-lactamase class A
VPQPQRRRRRTLRQRRIHTALGATVVIVGVLIGLSLSAHRPASEGPSTTVVGSTTSSTTLPTVTTTSPKSADLRGDLLGLLQRRTGTVEISVLNVRAAQTQTVGPDTPQDEASVIKVNILAAILSASSANNTPLTSSQQELAQQMIELSDNDAATQLWFEAGATDGIRKYDEALGLSETTLSLCVVCAGFSWPGWGLTTTTSVDEVKLLHAIFFGGGMLNASDREYELKLMESITASERWGVSNGVSSSAVVALKNGWLPLNSADTDWQINSVGWVRGDGRDYLVAMMSTGNPSEEYGIETLDAASAVVWRDEAN